MLALPKEAVEKSCVLVGYVHTYALYTKNCYYVQRVGAR